MNGSVVFCVQYQVLRGMWLGFLGDVVVYCFGCMFGIGVGFGSQ